MIKLKSWWNRCHRVRHMCPAAQKIHMHNDNNIILTGLQQDINRRHLVYLVLLQARVHCQSIRCCSLRHIVFVRGQRKHPGHLGKFPIVELYFQLQYTYEITVT